MGILNKIEGAAIFLHLLSWKAIFRIFLAVIIGVFLTFISIYYFSIAAPTLPEDNSVKLLTITDSIKKQISSIVKKSPDIVAVQVITLNFHKNIRVETYMNISNPIVQEAYDLYLKRKILEVPLFTVDKEKNNRIFSIINGEFTCTPYKESMAYKYAPQLDQVAITDVCSIGIPPYNNNISGLISVYLKYHPSVDEKQNIFLSMRDISNRIYRDSFP